MDTYFRIWPLVTCLAWQSFPLSFGFLVLINWLMLGEMGEHTCWFSLESNCTNERCCSGSFKYCFFSFTCWTCEKSQQSSKYREELLQVGPSLHVASLEATSSATIQCKVPTVRVRVGCWAFYWDLVSSIGWCTLTNWKKIWVLTSWTIKNELKLMIYDWTYCKYMNKFTFLSISLSFSLNLPFYY